MVTTRMIMACEPAAFFWLYFFILWFLGLLDKTLVSAKKITVVFILSWLWVPIFCKGYTYESTLLVETIPIIILGWPFFTKLFKPGITIRWGFLIIILAWVAQVIAVTIHEFYYPKCVSKYFLGTFGDLLGINTVANKYL
jgi:hypothetical protein